MAESRANRLIRTRCVVVAPFTQLPMLRLIACGECGALLWDIEKHFATSHEGGGRE